MGKVKVGHSFTKQDLEVLFKEIKEKPFKPVNYGSKSDDKKSKGRK